MNIFPSDRINAEKGLAPRLVSALYVEAMLLADEARGYFDEFGREERDTLTPLIRVTFSCESLKVTTRLMHIIAWLLTWRAVEAGEIDVCEAGRPERRLGDAPASEAGVLEALPERARAIVQASIDLYERVARLDTGMALPDMPVASPARELLGRLAVAF